MMLLLLAQALAQDGVNQVPADVAVPGWAVQETNPPLFDYDRTLAEAVRLRQAGDLAGSATLLEGLTGLVPADRMGGWLYQRGICAELQWKFTEARGFYEEVVARGGDQVVDARFRLALVLEDLGDPEGALAQVRALAKLRGFDEDDQLTLDLQAAITRVKAGDVRRGRAALTEALARGEELGGHTWIRAKGRHTLAACLLADADAISLRGNERRVVRRLKARIVAIQAAETEITTLVGLEEPEWIVASMIDLGDSWKRLGDDLAASPAPLRFSAEEARLYHEGLAPYAENARTKAWHYWDAGVELAHRLGFESPKVGVLKERRDSLGR